ncbi:MAG TPA: glycosyltransferase [Gaiellaceae bacterium]|nr:glycosyltransferase [Gaiellaceae bacterium]
MIVAYNALSLRPGVVDGGATYSLNVLHHLPRTLPEAEHVVLARPGETRIPAASNLRVEVVPRAASTRGRLVYELAGLAGALGRLGADLLISPNESVPRRCPCPVLVIAQNVVYHCGWEPAAFLGASARVRLGARAQAAYYRRRMPSAYRRAAAVVAVSEHAATLLEARAGLDRARTSVVPSGSDSFLLPDPPEVPRRECVLAVGALAPHRSLPATLAVFAELRRRQPALELVLAGGDWRGYRAVVEAEIERLGLRDSVEVAGAVPAERLVELYASSAALLHLSSCESFGLPLVEAMRYGLPVVAAAHGPSAEIAAGAAVLVDPTDPVAAAAEVGALLASAEQLEERRRRGRARAAKLTWERTAAGIADAARTIVA